MNKKLYLPEYEQLCALSSGFGDATNGIKPIEVAHLCWLGAQLPPNGRAVELGSHKCKSTTCIAQGMKSVGVDGKVYAVDLWLHGKGKTFEHYTVQETWNTFQQVCIDWNNPGIIIPVMMSTAEAAAFWASKEGGGNAIDLLFIDAGHDYENVHRDYELWSPFIPSGGRIAFHDYGTRFQGVNDVVNEALKQQIWTEISVYGRIWSARRK